MLQNIDVATNIESFVFCNLADNLPQSLLPLLQNCFHICRRSYSDTDCYNSFADLGFVKPLRVRVEQDFFKSPRRIYVCEYQAFQVTAVGLANGGRRRPHGAGTRGSSLAPTAHARPGAADEI